jgi:hypothetical protein
MSSAINTMCSALQDKLRKLSDSDDAPEGSTMFKEVEVGRHLSCKDFVTEPK